jgi:hypothetical protein
MGDVKFELHDTRPGKPTKNDGKSSFFMGKSVNPDKITILSIYLGDKWKKMVV